MSRPAQLITFQVGNDRIAAPPGTFVNMPNGQPHAFKNESDRSAKLIITLPPLPSKEEIQRLVAAAPKYGIEILGH